MFWTREGARYLTFKLISLVLNWIQTYTSKRPYLNVGRDLIVIRSVRFYTVDVESRSRSLHLPV